ncbi:Sister chromatid cohesion protein pds5 [Malassezia caprae]|uniref:Sister chromatid cohesion protein pds5 n=1 Tax=Malassezia caprae TaxID=1381934 RepID=A0AAF0ED91_9BASI|nr:Sister chromatid cohesion protein pds5 [Malassezia caprae]
MPQRLRFEGPLYVAGTPPNEVRARLTVLHKELAGLDQGTIDTSELDAYCRELIRPALLRHKDRGVQSMTACILADVLRLYAPNAPFSPSEIKSLFRFLLAQLVAPSAGLAHPEHALYKDAVYVLDSLSTVKSVVLVCDLPSGNDIMTEYFEKLWALTESDLAKNVELAMTDVFVQLLEESASVPQAVVHVLMSALATEPTSTAATMATNVCRPVQDRLQKHVARYFATAMHDSQYDDADDVDAIEALELLHAQIVRVAEAVPSLLTSVVPQLEAELGVDDDHVRHLATRVLGALFAMTSGGASDSFIHLYPSAWKAWLGRAVDKRVAIRNDWIQSAVRVLCAHESVAPALTSALAARAVDPDEHVRTALADAIGSLDYESLKHKVPTRVLHELAQRGKDRRASVRQSALVALGRAFDLACTDADDAAATAKFGWIPGAMLACVLAGACEVARSVTHAWETYIMPFVDLPSYMQRLLRVWNALAEQERTIFLHMTNLRLARPTAMDVWLDCCRGEGLECLDACVRAVAATLGDAEAPGILASFAASPDEAVMDAMQVCFDPATPLAESVARRHEARARMEDALMGAADTLYACLWAGSFPLLNQSCVLPLLDAQATELVTYVATEAPYLCAPHASALSERVIKGDVLALKLFAALLRHDSAAVSATPALLEALRTQTASQAEAALALACLAPDAVPSMAEEMRGRIASGSAAERATAITGLAHVCVCAPTEMAPLVDKIVEDVLQHILLAPWPISAGQYDDLEWLDERDPNAPPDLAARVAALRLLVHICAAQDASSAGVAPILKLLWIVLGAGEAQAGQQTPAAIRARLRSGAAEALLDLAAHDALTTRILPRMGRFVYVLQDECFQVRSHLLSDLLSRLARDKLPVGFHALLFLVAFDPESEQLSHVASYVRRVRLLPEALRQQRLEDVWVRFLYLLSHHPDLQPDQPAQLVSFARYMDFYLRCVATQDNISLLAHYSTGVRGFLDVASDHNHEANHALHVVAELAQLVLQRKADKEGWTIQSVSSTTPCPTDILREGPSPTHRILDPATAERILAGDAKPRGREKKSRIGS